ncbi:MAG: hypothetical protein OXU54_06210 [Gammaproteobacteria bacterium]|nr:hypothetical protein [Gammaproteobacteria bacterium]
MKEREARALYAGFLLSQEWRGKGQEWRGGGHGNGGVGFIRWMPAGFLHRLFFSVIPAKAGIPRKYSAVRAHSRNGGGGRRREFMAARRALEPS